MRLSQGLARGLGRGNLGLFWLFQISQQLRRGYFLFPNFQFGAFERLDEIKREIMEALAVDFGESDDDSDKNDDHAGRDEKREVKNLVKDEAKHAGDHHFDELPDGYRAEDLILGV